MTSVDYSNPAVGGATSTQLSALVKRGVRGALPLSVRKRLAVIIARQRWLPQRHWWSVELVRDLAVSDNAEYHRFLWGHHLGYAQTYEIDERFGAERVHPTRVMLFEQLLHLLAERNKNASDVQSVLEVGCSMGYLLRHLELNVFPNAQLLDGFDIDQYAVEQGSSYLAQQRSRVRLARADMLDVNTIFDDARYDVIVCAGVLMYVSETEAEEVVKRILRRSRGIVAFAGLAHPTADNRTLTASEPRASDQSLIHNIDRMVESAGGKVVARRWEGSLSVQGNTVYFIYAEPGQDPDPIAA